MKTIDFLMSALAFSMVMNALCLGIAFAAVLALRADIRREAAEKMKLLPGWAQRFVRGGEKVR